MNIQVQCCGLVLLLVILYFYIRRKKINLNTGKAFFRLFYITLGSISLDILSIILLTRHEAVPELVIDIVCKLYLCTMILTALATLHYVCVDIYNESGYYRRCAAISGAIAAIGIMAVLCLPINKEWSSPDHIYTYGPSVLTTYLFSFAFLATVVWFLIFRKNRMDIRRWDVTRVWMILWLGAATVQFFNNELLLVGFASAIGLIIIYLKLENPELIFDKATGFFNQEAMLLYADQLHRRGKGYAVLEMIFPHSMSRHVSRNDEATPEDEIRQYLFAVENAYTFLNDEDEVILIFEDMVIAQKTFANLKNRFEFGWGKDGNIYVNPEWIYVQDGRIVPCIEDVLPFLRYIRQNAKRLLVEDTVYVDEKIVHDMHEERKIEVLITEAIDNDRVEVFYQPIYSTEEKRFSSAEALVRIRTEDGKIVPPGMFINIAEKNGMIMKLGEIVFEKVCRFLRDHKPERYGLDYIEVNLSVVQCAYEHLADNFMFVMEKYQVKPSQINLEITESASVSEKMILQENMRKLMDYGVKFSLDDFGTGQSNLNYIVEMPVDIVKFDRNMIVSYFENGKAKYVMDAAMHMIHGMELQIVSEGIETREQFDTMKDLGISYIQGYYFSKPLPEAEFLQFISEHYQK